MNRPLWASLWILFCGGLLGGLLLVLGAYVQWAIRQ